MPRRQTNRLESLRTIASDRRLPFMVPVLVALLVDASLCVRRELFAVSASAVLCKRLPDLLVVVPWHAYQCDKIFALQAVAFD